nr:uncharacterized protein LOC113815069 [Penaeus vannamei]
MLAFCGEIQFVSGVDIPPVVVTRGGNKPTFPVAAYHREASWRCRGSRREISGACSSSLNWKTSHTLSSSKQAVCNGDGAYSCNSSDYFCRLFLWDYLCVTCLVFCVTFPYSRYTIFVAFLCVS